MDGEAGCGFSDDSSDFEGISGCVGCSLVVESVATVGLSVGVFDSEASAPVVSPFDLVVGSDPFG